MNDDVFEKINKYEAKQELKKKPKPIEKWTGMDFARYLKGRVTMEEPNSLDSDAMLKIYDALCKKLPDMNNQVLKDYLDWWANTFGDCIKKVYTPHLINYVDQFVKVL